MTSTTNAFEKRRLCQTDDQACRRKRDQQDDRRHERLPKLEAGERTDCNQRDGKSSKLFESADGQRARNHNGDERIE